MVTIANGSQFPFFIVRSLHSINLQSLYINECKCWADRTSKKLSAAAVSLLGENHCIQTSSMSSTSFRQDSSHYCRTYLMIAFVQRISIISKIIPNLTLLLPHKNRIDLGSCEWGSQTIKILMTSNQWISVENTMWWSAVVSCTYPAIFCCVLPRYSRA
jgi:hypothetical protein